MHSIQKYPKSVELDLKGALNTLSLNPYYIKQIYLNPIEFELYYSYIILRISLVRFAQSFKTYFFYT